MEILAVVPIVINAGAAVLPTIVAAVASVAAVVLHPKTLGQFIRRRPWLTASVVAVVVLLLFFGSALWRSVSPGRATVRAGSQTASQIDWAKVAKDIIAQEKLRQPGAATVSSTSGTSATTTAPASATATVVSTAPDRTASPAPRAQDFTRSFARDGISPAGLKPLWSFQPEGTLFLSTPAIFGDRIYVGASQTDLGGYTGLFACLGLETGKPIWEVTEMGKDTLLAFFSSPAVTDDGKYVIVGQGLHQDRNCSAALLRSRDRKLHWAVKTPLHIESSPAIFGDMTVVGAGAIEGSTGRPTGDPGYVFAVRISDGQLLWKQAVNDPESSPAIDEAGIVYIGSGFNGSAVVALRSGSDEELRTQKLERIVWRTSVAYPVVAPVTLLGDLVIVGGGNGDMVHSNKNAQGVVVALNRRTGEIVWQTKLEEAVLGSIAAREGMLIAPLRTGEVAALASSDGRILWRARERQCSRPRRRRARQGAGLRRQQRRLSRGVRHRQRKGARKNLSQRAGQAGHGFVAFLAAGRRQPDHRRQRNGRTARAAWNGGQQMIAGKKFTKSLVNCRDTALMGGKAASLGRLIRAGFQVPGGFVVNTVAYRLAHTPMPEPGRAAEIPTDVVAEIRARYEAMGGGPVAVRSSATAEDMAAASMAGQCETFLDVEGDAALLEAVKRCMALGAQGFLVKHPSAMVIGCVLRQALGADALPNVPLSLAGSLEA